MKKLAAFVLCLALFLMAVSPALGCYGYGGAVSASGMVYSAPMIQRSYVVPASAPMFAPQYAPTTYADPGTACPCQGVNTVPASAPMFAPQLAPSYAPSYMPTISAAPTIGYDPGVVGVAVARPLFAPVLSPGFTYGTTFGFNRGFGLGVGRSFGVGYGFNTFVRPRVGFVGGAVFAPAVRTRAFVPAVAAAPNVNVTINRRRAINVIR